MTIFDFLNSILYTKKRVELNCDDESQFTTFMVNRWSSFYSKELAEYINQTSNVYSTAFNTKQEQFDYLFNVLPKLKYKKIEYNKKQKKDKEEDNIIIPEFMSQREYKQYVELSSSFSK